MKKAANFTLIRQSILTNLNELTPAQLNVIPAGFNNNIIWNLGHLSATVQRIFYSRSGGAGPLPLEFVDRYKNGTKPEGIVGEEEIAYIKEWLLKGIEQFEADFPILKAGTYESWTSSYGVAVNTLNEALIIMHYHEGTHAGIMMAMKKIVTQPKKAQPKK